MSDPFAQALTDYYHDEFEGPLVARRGETTVEQDVDHYFAEVTDGGWLDDRLQGPLLDLGAGVGRHALYFQTRFETVAVERSDQLVAVMADRGVEDARVADMFSLREHFEPDRFRSALSIGTQASLARSLEGLRAFLDELDYVTTSDATAVVDGFDPGHERTRTKVDYYADRTDGMAYRLLQLEYDGTLGEPWLYRLFTPDRYREAAADTGWEVAEVRRGDGWEHMYNLALRKE